ncbi:hypothetical protein SUGI_0503720 [Cryptomeria japonica]|nr:hypothetical protein SUGI_0503720 [Cryptomeria japonica]
MGSTEERNLDKKYRPPHVSWFHQLSSENANPSKSQYLQIKGIAKFHLFHTNFKSVIVFFKVLWLSHVAILLSKRNVELSFILSWKKELFSLDSVLRKRVQLRVHLQQVTE